MSGQYYGRWQVDDADGVERPAFLRVQLDLVSQDRLNELLDEYRRQVVDFRNPDIEGNIITWLAERGVDAEIVPISPGMF